MPARDRNDRFRHEALLYAGQEDFVRRTGAFLRDAVDAEEPILVAVSASKIELLRSALGAVADAVHFVDMDELGRNPGRIIPAWHEFVAEQAPAGRRFRGVGEPIWAGRTPEELAEAERHEALLNLAFADAPAWWLICPYDTQTLPPELLEAARRNHPSVLDAGTSRQSPLYEDPVAKPFDRPLPEPRGPVAQLAFAPDDLHEVRRFVERHAATRGMDDARTSSLVLAVDELATNSIRHGGGHGVVRAWQEGDTMVCEVHDEGSIGDPLAGRHLPVPEDGSGFGLWLVNQLCDLVQVRVFPAGAVVRVHMARR